MLKDPDFNIKIVVCGSPSTGKSSLCSRYATSTFSESVSPSNDTATYVVKVEVNGQSVSTEVWDFIGEKSAKASDKRKFQYVGAMTIIVCVDLTNQETMQDAFDYVSDKTDNC